MPVVDCVACGRQFDAHLGKRVHDGYLCSSCCKQWPVKRDIGEVGERASGEESGDLRGDETGDLDLPDDVPPEMKAEFEAMLSAARAAANAPRDIKCGECGHQGKVAAYDVVGKYPEDMVFPILGKHRPTAFMMFECPRCKSHIAVDPIKAVRGGVMVGNSLDAGTGRDYEHSPASRVGCTIAAVVFGALIVWALRAGCESAGNNADLDHFRNSILLRNSALKTGDNAFTQQEKVRLMVESLDLCLAEARRVPDSALARLHPGLPKRYRNEFCEGVRLCRDGLEQADVTLMQRGDDLLDRFGDWYERELKR